MAGHSKFKNIMHRKGAQDKKRAKVFSRLGREISVSVKSVSWNSPKHSFEDYWAELLIDTSDVLRIDWFKRSKQSNLVEKRFSWKRFHASAHADS